MAPQNWQLWNAALAEGHELNILESTLCNDRFHKSFFLAQWFFSKWFLKDDTNFSPILNYHPLQEGMVLYLNKLESLYPRMLYGIKFVRNWPSGSCEVENVKSLQDKMWAAKLTWAFGLCELKTWMKMKQLTKFKFQQWITVLCGIFKSRSGLVWLLIM